MTPVRPLLVNSEDLRGGAARAAYRLHLALQDIGVEARMLVQIKHGDAKSVVGPDSPLSALTASLRPAADLLPVLAYRRRTSTTFYPGWLPDRMARRIAPLAPDLVHLHWIAGGALNVRTLRNLQRPIVWTLHDMWAFTGGCHHDDGCGRFRNGCGACPVLASTCRIDLSSLGWRRKQRAYRGLPMHVVAPSRWLADLAANSPLLGQFPVSVIPNPINVQTFRPIDKHAARKMLGLPPDGQVVLFGALRATSMQSKGFPLLVDALQRFSRRGPKRDRYLLVLGASRPEQVPDCGMPSVYAGTLSDDVSLALSYSAADVYVTPSRQENLSNMVMESLSCGTPVVAFSIGGMPDMVEHLRNGYLAQPFEPEDLARGIEWVLEDEGRHAGLRARARDKALEEYESGKIAHRYRDLYEQVLEPAKAKGLGSQ